MSGWFFGGSDDEGKKRPDVYIPKQSSGGQKKDDGCPLAVLYVLTGLTGVVWSAINAGNWLNSII